MFDMKYIVIMKGDGAEGPVIFSSLDQHADMALKLMGPNDTVIGAGFITYTKDGVQCWGSSVSLKIKSRPEQDSRIINHFFGVDS